MAKKTKTDEKHIYCRGCGVELAYVKKYDDEGLPCNEYCCGRCCPYRKQSPCPKEKAHGTVTENLAKLQS